MEMNYLPLNEYSNKYKVSVSTLRRKIKTNDIQYRFDQGRYFILDKVASKTSYRPSHFLSSQTSEPNPSLNAEQDFLQHQNMAPMRTEEPILTAANKLLTELKAAYTRILQEKEEQILHLNEEVTDLKTLVRVLESDNERLRLQKK